MKYRQEQTQTRTLIVLKRRAELRLQDYQMVAEIQLGMVHLDEC